ncbi:MAG: alanyl-tRNA editing protein [Acidobacteriota bacterium]
MTETPSFLASPRLRELQTEVLTIGESEGRRFAVLSDTILYPEGGGQPPDHGTLAGLRVADVQKRGGEIRHFLSGDGDLAPGPARVELDWARRFDHMQQHSAQHLLTAVAADRFGWPTTSFHLGAELCAIEIDAASLGDRDLERLEEAVAEEIRAARPIRTRFVSPRDYEELGARSRGLPAGHVGDVRLVEIEGVDLAACGGTHVHTTAEIEAVQLLGAESLRGGQRLTFLAGRRVRGRLRAHERRGAELRRVLGAADDELVQIARGKLDQLKEMGRQRRRLLGELAELLIDRLRAEGAPLVERHFDGVDLGFLGSLGRGLCTEESRQVALLTGTDAAKGSKLLLIAAGGAAGLDAQALGRQAAEILGGRGGGSGRIFQGKVASLERRGEVVVALEAALADPS